MELEHFDVLIVGAGLSGIGAACHLQRECPAKTFAILEARETIGGTWDLFRYPGVRSDSDMFTLGYSFRPWKEAKVLADGDSIRNYVRDTARQHDVERKIRFRHRIVQAEWSTAEARWAVTIERTVTKDGQETTETTQVSCGFLFVCSGYYRYDQGYTPEFAGRERFLGQILHPQHWPENLDYAGKRVVVIGSGATAVTLVPAMAEQAAHVTMLQRSPTYIVSLPSRDPIADVLRKRLPAKTAYSVVRWKNVLVSTLGYQVSRRSPRVMKSLMRRGIERALPRGYDLDTHFKPRYEPWDQRLCLVPDNDLFQAISSGKASVVTDRITSFTEKGLLLESGAELEAEIVVTATGLNLLMLGGIKLVVDGRAIESSKTVSYKGMMLCGVPNFAFGIGYTNASWTLKMDLVSTYVCRLLKRMDARRERYCIPRAPDPSLPTEPFLNLQSGYVERALPNLPRQGARSPWRLHQNYIRDVLLLRWGPLDDEGMSFVRS